MELVKKYFYLDRITYQYRENSIHHRRYKQRQRMKELIGKRHRSLVEIAKNQKRTKKMFLDGLTIDQQRAIEKIFETDSVNFWRACRGKVFLELPPRVVQLDLPFDESFVE